MLPSFIESITNFLGWEVEEDPEIDLEIDSDSESISDISDISDISELSDEEIEEIEREIESIDVDVEEKRERDEEEEEEEKAHILETKGKLSPKIEEEEEEDIYDKEQKIDKKIVKMIPKLPSNLAFINFSKPIPTDIENGVWDFLTLYKALFYSLHNDTLPNRINNHRLSRYNLVLNKSQNENNEILKLEKEFHKRYNLLKTMEQKIESLMFVKNGQYIKAVEHLEKLNKSKEETLKDYMLLKKKDDAMISLNKQEERQLNNFEYLRLEINKYERFVIGDITPIIQLYQKKKQEKENIIKKLEKFNQDFETSGSIPEEYKETDAKNIFNNLIKKHKINLNKPVQINDSNNPNHFLKSKMIFHLKNFLDISTNDALLLLEDNLFDKVISFNNFDTNQKLDLIKMELKDLEPIAEYLTHMRDRVLICPHCAYRNGQHMKMIMHVSDHKKGTKPLLVVKPRFNKETQKYENVYDNKTSDDVNDIYFHMKQTNKLIPISMNVWSKLDQDTINTMSKNVIRFTKDDDTSKTSKKRVVEKFEQTGKTELQKELELDEDVDTDIESLFGDDSDSDKFDEIVEITKEEKREKERENFEESLKVIEFPIYRMLTEIDEEEKVDENEESKKNKRKTKIDKICKEASYMSNKSMAHKWVKFIMTKYLSMDIFEKFKMDDILVNVNGLVFNFSNINNIPDIVNDVTINNEKFIQNQVIKGENEKMEISRESLINLIKVEIFMEKLKTIVIEFAKYDSNDINLSNNINTYVDLFMNFFTKLIKSDRNDIDEIFDRIILKLTDVTDQNVLHNRLLGYDDDLNKKRRGIIEKRTQRHDIDDILYYMLLSYLPPDNDVVQKVYNTIEVNHPNVKKRTKHQTRLLKDKQNAFINKNKVWEWSSIYKNEFGKIPEDYKENINNFHYITLDETIAKLNDDLNMELGREVMAKYPEIFEKMEFENYNTDKKEIKRYHLVKDFLEKSYHRGLIERIDFRLLMVIMLLQKMEEVFGIIPFGKKTTNVKVMVDFVNVMNLYVKEKKEYKVVKGKRGVLQKNDSISNKVPLNKEEEKEQKDLLLNDFMNLDEESLELRSEIEREINSPVDLEDDGEEVEDVGEIILEDNDDIMDDREIDYDEPLPDFENY